MNSRLPVSEMKPIESPFSASLHPPPRIRTPSKKLQLPHTLKTQNEQRTQFFSPQSIPAQAIQQRQRVPFRDQHGRLLLRFSKPYARHYRTTLPSS